jgi:hypothetical protein
MFVVVELRRQEDRHGDRILLVNNTMLHAVAAFGKALLRCVMMRESRTRW